MTATTVKGFPTEQVQQAIDAILTVLGEPSTELHKPALGAIAAKDFDTVKRLSTVNPRDRFCKALGSLGGAYKLTPYTPTILTESARAVAEFAKERILDHLGADIDRRSIESGCTRMTDK